MAKKHKKRGGGHRPDPQPGTIEFFQPTWTEDIVQTDLFYVPTGDDTNIKWWFFVSADGAPYVRSNLSESSVSVDAAHLADYYTVNPFHIGQICNIYAEVRSAQGELLSRSPVYTVILD